MIRKFFKNLFIPGEHNSFRPKAIRHHAISLYSIALIFSQLSFGIVAYSPLAANPKALEPQIIDLVNQERAKNSLPALTENRELANAAKAKLNDMFAKNYWDHTAPDGTKAWYFILNEQYSYTVAGENLARGFTSAGSMAKAWMNSKTHRDNILNLDYQDTGVAVGNGTVDGKMFTVAVQLFGTTIGSQNRTLVAGQQTTFSNLSTANPIQKERMPFFVFYIILFALLIFDAIMVKINGLHKSKKHILAFRLSLALNIIVLVILTLNFTSVT